MELLSINNLLTVGTVLNFGKVLLFLGYLILIAAILFLILAGLVYRAKRHQEKYDRVRDEFTELIYRQNIGEIPTDENTPAPGKPEREKDWYED